MLAGGNTAFAGFRERFEVEAIQQGTCAGVTRELRLHGHRDPSTRVNTCWDGGSIMASLATFRDGAPWVTRARYEEYGPKLVHRKCL